MRVLAAQKWELAQITEEGMDVKKDPENCFSRSNFFSGFYSVSRLSIVQIWRLDRTVGG
jgi:hypothetical protein